MRRTIVDRIGPHIQRVWFRTQWLYDYGDIDAGFYISPYPVFRRPGRLP